MQTETDNVLAKIRAHFSTGKTVVVFYVGEAGAIEVDFMVSENADEHEVKKLVARAAYETYALKDDHKVG